MVHKYHKIKHHVRRALIGAALVIFFADLVAAIWPAFDGVWKGIAHVAVSFAALAAFACENLISEEIEHYEDTHDQ